MLEYCVFQDDQLVTRQPIKLRYPIVGRNAQTFLLVKDAFTHKDTLYRWMPVTNSQGDWLRLNDLDLCARYQVLLLLQSTT